MSAKKITDAMRAALFNLHHDHAIHRGLRGRSAFGGLTRTCASLTDRGLIDLDCKLTDEGAKLGRELFGATRECTSCHGAGETSRTKGLDVVPELCFGCGGEQARCPHCGEWCGAHHDHGCQGLDDE